MTECIINKIKLIKLLLTKCIMNNIKTFKNIVKITINKEIDPIEYFVCDKRKFVYVVNSKVACSSIKKSLMGITEPIENYVDIHKEAQRRGYIKYELTEEQQKYFKFTFVRHPLNRFISMYTNKFLDTISIRNNGFEFANYFGGIFSQHDSIETVAKKISIIDDQLSDRHFKSQYMLTNNLDFIGKLESINDDYQVIIDKFGVLPLERENCTSLKIMKPNLTQKTKLLIESRYKKDYESFSYDT